MSSNNLQNSRLIVLREHQKARIGSAWSAEHGCVGRIEAAAIQAHQLRTNRKLFRFGFDHISATHWIGLIGLHDKCIEVLPKIHRNDIVETRRNLVHMICRAGEIPVADADITMLSRSPEPLPLAYLQHYVNRLSNEWRRGPLRQYRALEDNRRYLKGKLILSMHLQLNIGHRELFLTQADEFIEDNPWTRLLKYALLLCERQTISMELSRSSRQLLGDFEGVGEFQSDMLPYLNAPVHRHIKRFEPCILLARLIINWLAPTAVQDYATGNVHSLMFDMNRVFERFIAAEVSACFRGNDYQVRSQSMTKSLLFEGSKSRFGLQPDICIRRGGRISCIVDTKWKDLSDHLPNHGISQSDIYQMFAYGKEFRSPCVILLYPSSIGQTAVRTVYHHRSETDCPDMTRSIVVATIDISNASQQKEFRSQLRQLLLNFLN